MSQPIPAIEELKQLPQWVCWTYVNRNGKQTKPPMLPNGKSAFASSTDAATWGTYDAATAAMRLHNYQGVGFVFTDADEYAGIDLDDCLDEKLNIADWAKKIVTAVNSYTEISPSERGLKIFIKGKVSRGIRKDMGNGGAVEMYSNGRYFTVTGRHWGNTPLTIEERAEEVMQLLNELDLQPETAVTSPLPNPLDLSYWQLSKEIENLIHSVPAVGNRSEDDQRVITALVSRGASDYDITRIFQTYPIGTQGKYRAKGQHGDKYLSTSIANARRFVPVVNPPTHAQPNGNGKLAKRNDNTPQLDIDIKNPKTKDYLKAFEMLEFKFRLNELDDSIEVNGERMNDIVAADICNRMRDIGLSSVGWVERAWSTAAAKDTYNPLKEMLSELKWDGHDWIRNFVQGYTTETSGLGEIAFKRWMIGAVAKVFEGAQNFMMVWDGPQGVGKSHLANWLCPWNEYFLEGAIRPDDKDAMLRACTHLVWEVGELQATTRKSDKEALKDFITKQTVTVRRAYGRFDMVKPTTVNFIGTINEDGAGFLTDPTGSRRFVIICFEAIDWRYSANLDAKNLWAQAYALYKQGEQWNLTSSEKSLQNQVNEKYQMDSLVADMLFEHYVITNDPEDYETVNAIMDTLYLNGLRGNQRSTMMELSRIMSRLRLEKIRPRLEGQRPTAFTGIKKKPKKPVEL